MGADIFSVIDAYPAVMALACSVNFLVCPNADSESDCTRIIVDLFDSLRASGILCVQIYFTVIKIVFFLFRNHAIKCLLNCCIACDSRRGD